jgi:hypothetical protein
VRRTSVYTPTPDISLRRTVQPRSRQIYCETFEVGERAVSQCSLMGSAQDHPRRLVCFEWHQRSPGFNCEAKRSRCLKIDCKLEFDVKVIPHKGDTDWIEPLIFKMNDCLRGETIPAANPTCEYCGYREAAGKELQARVKKPVTKSNKSATLGI